MSSWALLWADKFVLITITLSVSRLPVREGLFFRGIHATVRDNQRAARFFPTGSLWLPATCLATPPLSAEPVGTLAGNSWGRPFLGEWISARATRARSGTLAPGERQWQRVGRVLNEWPPKAHALSARGAAFTPLQGGTTMGDRSKPKVLDPTRAEAA
jgi:hypothetical protein